MFTYIYIYIYLYIYLCIYIYTQYHTPTTPQGGLGNIAPVYPYPFLLLTTIHYYSLLLLTTTNPPNPLPTHRGGGEHSSRISIPIPTTNYYSLTTTYY